MAPTLKHSDSVISVAISPDQKTLASATTGGTVTLWNVATRAKHTIEAHE